MLMLPCERKARVPPCVAPGHPAGPPGGAHPPRGARGGGHGASALYLEGHAFERIVTEATEEMSRRSTGFAVTDRVSGILEPSAQSRRIGGAGPGRLEPGRSGRALRILQTPLHKARCPRAAAVSRPRGHVPVVHRPPLAGWRQEFVLFAPEFPDEQRTRLEAKGWMCHDLRDIQRLLSGGGGGGKGPLRTSPKIRGED